MNKKLLAALCASAMILSVCTACGDDSTADSTDESSASDRLGGDEFSEESSEESSEEESSEAEPVEAEDIEFEEPVVADAGDAILAIADGQWYVQYWGTTDDILTYDAGVAHIDGDGDYTVSVNVGTKGAQFDITGEVDNGYQCESISFAAIKVFEGTTLFPNMCIEIKEIRVDGTPINMTAKNYTSSDDGKEMRANIYNAYVSNFPDDAHTAEGAVTGEFGEYSSMILDLADVAKWTSIEVDFTVTGTGDAAEGGDEADAETDGEAEGEDAE